MSSDSLIDYRSEGGVAFLTLTNPPANAYSFAMMKQLDAAILEARFDDAVHVLVVAGAGEKVFCAGADIAMLNAVTPSFKYNFCLHANETLLRLEQTPKLVIGALNGHCVGGGLEIAMACDLRIARRGGFKIGLPEVNLGVLPGTGGTQRLARLVGKSRAIELMALGETFSCERALAIGLLTAIFDAEGFDEKIGEYARQFCPPHKASFAVGRIKRAVQSGAEIPLESGLALERELQQELFCSADAGEGIAAYIERRKPVFRGR